MKNHIKLVTTDRETALFPQFVNNEDQIEYLESLLSSLSSFQEAGPSNVFSAKMAALVMLSSAYNRSGYRRAAVDAIKQLEVLFFAMLDWAAGPLDDKFTDLLVYSYCRLGYFADARRVADLTAKKVASKLTKNSREAANTAKWLKDQYNIAINEHEKRGERRAASLRTLKLHAETLVSQPEHAIVLATANSVQHFIGA